MARFRLQSILDLKQRLEDAQQQTLAGLMLQRLRADEALHVLEQQADAQQQALAAQVSAGRVDPSAVRAALAYIDSVRGAMAAERERIEAIGAQVRQSREQLTEIAREKHVIERLRDRQAAAEAMDAERREQRAADELAAQRFARHTLREGVRR